MNAGNAQHARCPRCGYDLHGAMQQWTGHCPLEGRCTECGLDFTWHEVLDPGYGLPRWLVEFPRWRGFVRRCVWTLLATLWPWRLWGRVKMSHPMRPWRILLYLALIIPLGLGSFMVGQGTAAVVVHTALSTPPHKIVPPLTLHDAVAGAMFMPWADTSPRSFTVPGGALPYPGALGVHRWVGFSGVGIKPGWKFLNWRHAMSGLLFQAVLLLLCPIGFIAMPVSRRKAKVRWAHIGRVTLYSFGWMYVPALVLGIAWMIQPYWFEPAWLLHGLGVFGAMAGVLIFAVLFWQAAIGRYLRIPHSAGVALAMVIVAVLIVAVADFYGNADLLSFEF